MEQVALGAEGPPHWLGSWGQLGRLLSTCTLELLALPRLAGASLDQRPAPEQHTDRGGLWGVLPPAPERGTHAHAPLQQ